jgi:hypothetical protein
MCSFLPKYFLLKISKTVLKNINKNKNKNFIVQ